MVIWYINGRECLRLAIIAHRAPEKEDHTLEKHIEGVLHYGLKHANSFDPYGITAIAAIAHDLGKKTNEFQHYIRSDTKVRGTVKHALGGSLTLNSIEPKDERLLIAGMIVAGHHAGVPSFIELYHEKLNNVEGYLKFVPEMSLKEITHIKEILSKSLSIKSEDRLHFAYLEMLGRMCYSALVDADYLDTETYMDHGKSLDRAQIKSHSIVRLHNILMMHMDEKMKQSDKTLLNERRKNVFFSCVKEGIAPIPFRSLNVPTGVGKTLASMGYALTHAKEHHKTRVIVAIPYTSIIEQNANEYKQIFGESSVLEHHSQMELNEEDEKHSSTKLAIENWDCPIVVTTTVQLFESLFSNRPSKCRKLHRITNSIIILDEFQKLPTHLLKPIFAMLDILIKKFNVTVLVSSATPLSFDRLDLFGNLENSPVEIIDNNELMLE